MIRTRDLAIFIAALFVLAACVAITLLVQRNTSHTENDVSPLVVMPYSPREFVAVSNQDTPDRQSVIDHLRNLLAQNEPEVDIAPSVEETVGLTDADISTTTQEEQPGTLVQTCAEADDALAVARSWPLSDVSLQSGGGLRQVIHTGESSSVVSSDATSTSSAPADGVSEQTLIQLPLSPFAAATPHCVPSDIIGVTVSGSLLFNSDASFYKGYGPEQLIGYARDGFPVYGYYQGQVDQCGGYMHSSGYRYTISGDAQVVLKCFTAEPVPFVYP